MKRDQHAEFVQERMKRNGAKYKAQNFRELEQKMSPESRARSDAKTRKLKAKIKSAISDDMWRFGYSGSGKTFFFSLQMQFRVYIPVKVFHQFRHHYLSTSAKRTEFHCDDWSLLTGPHCVEIITPRYDEGFYERGGHIFLSMSRSCFRRACRQSLR